MKTTKKTHGTGWLLFFSFLFAVCLFQQLSPATNAQAASKKGYSTTDDLNMRKKASSSSTILKKFDKGDSFTVTGSSGNWYKVTSGSKKGYIYKKYVTFSKSSTSSTSTSTSKGSQVVAYAKKFVGNPYRYGGTSLTKGADCSGFTQSVYKKFGVSLPRTSSEQRSAGKKVSGLKNAKAGDLICYYGHVAIYMGNNKIVHASSKKTGIKISNNANYRAIASIRRVL